MFKLDKKDIAVIITILIISWLIAMFTANEIEIGAIVIGLYLIHKYTRNIENSKEYLEFEFIDKEKYHKGTKNFILAIEVYLIIRLLVIIFTKYNRFNILELCLIQILITWYESHLSSKYVKSIKGVRINKKRPFVKNKTLTLVILILFGGFTYTYLKNVSKIQTDDFIKVGEYEYKLSYEQNGKKTVEVKTSGGYMKAEENDKNSKYFNYYIKESKKLLNQRMTEDYSFKSMIFMIVLILSQGKLNKDAINSISKVTYLFLFLFVVFALIKFSGSSIDLENQLFTYFGQYLSIY
jgi:hypothetical protein